MRAMLVCTPSVLTLGARRVGGWGGMGVGGKGGKRRGLPVGNLMRKYNLSSLALQLVRDISTF